MELNKHGTCIQVCPLYYMKSWNKNYLLHFWKIKPLVIVINFISCNSVILLLIDHKFWTRIFFILSVMLLVKYILTDYKNITKKFINKIIKSVSVNFSIWFLKRKAEKIKGFPDCMLLKIQPLCWTLQKNLSFP